MLSILMAPVTDPFKIVLDDAEQIADQLVPAPNKVAAAVGVLIQQVGRLADGKLSALSDEALGKPAPEPAVVEAPAAGGNERIAELEAEVGRLSGELADARKS